ncbi:MAG: alginate O-acetyltransferase AlgF [Pseudomonadota bacterium]
MARRARTPLLLCLLACGSAAAPAAGPKLYETGPAQDAAFIRFINGTDQKLEVVSGKARMDLQPASDYLPVKPNSELKGSFEGAAGKSAIAVKTAPGAFTTVVALVPAGQKAPVTTFITETPDDFNALKSFVALYNFDAGCKGAQVKVAGRDTALFTGVASGAMQRRAVNPVALGVQLVCDGKPSGKPLDLGTLAAGMRYSLVLVPSAATGSRLIFASDDLAR